MVLEQLECSAKMDKDKTHQDNACMDKRYPLSQRKYQTLGINFQSDQSSDTCATLSFAKDFMSLIQSCYWTSDLFLHTYFDVVIQRLLRRLLQHQFSSFFHAAIWCQSFKQPSFRNCPAVKTIWHFFVSSSILFLMMMGLFFLCSIENS